MNSKLMVVTGCINGLFQLDSEMFVAVGHVK